MTAVLFFTAYGALKLVYPTYTLTRFVEAVTWYHLFQVQHPPSSFYSSSLLSLWINLTGYYHKQIELLVAAALILMAPLWVFRCELLQFKEKTKVAGVIFIYAGASSIFADYYLLVFWFAAAILIRPVSEERQGASNLEELCFVILAVVLLATKHFGIITTNFNSLINNIAVMLGITIIFCLTLFQVISMAQSLSKMRRDDNSKPLKD